MKRIIGILILMVLLVSAVAHAQIFLGSIQGFVFNVTNGTVAGAEVNVTVSGKSGAGSTGTGFTDSSGFYLIVNLNAGSGDLLLVQANKSGDFGTSNDTADATGAGFANITIFEVPSSPTLVPIADSHNNTLTVFNWTSGTDPNALATFDIWRLIGESTINNSFPPVNQSFLDFDNYTWQVETCNSFGCSIPATDSFQLFNSPPPTPTLVDVADTANNTIFFNWTSGGADPDGDDTFFIFVLDGTQSSNVTPGFFQVVSNGSHTWQVQECDPFECSGFDTDTFSVVNAPPSAPTLVPANDTVLSFVTTSWTSGVDPDGAATFDEVVINNVTTIVNATSPLTFSTVGDILEINWSVRTCDVGGACSAFVTDSFIKFDCNITENVSVAVPGGGRGSGGGGGGGGGSGPFCNVGQKICQDVTTAAECVRGLNRIEWQPTFCGEGNHCRDGECRSGPFCAENWICEPFSECKEDGTQDRQCVDLHGCGSTDFLPPLTRTCEYEEPQLIPPVEEIPGVIQDAIEEVIDAVVETIKERPEIVFVPSSLVLVLLIIIALGWRNEARGVLFHMRVKKFNRHYKKDPVKAVHEYFNQIKPQYKQVKDHIFDKTDKLFKEVSKKIEKK